MSSRKRKSCDVRDFFKRRRTGKRASFEDVIGNDLISEQLLGLIELKDLIKLRQTSKHMKMLSEQLLLRLKVAKVGNLANKEAVSEELTHSPTVRLDNFLTELVTPLERNLGFWKGIVEKMNEKVRIPIQMYRTERVIAWLSQYAPNLRNLKLGSWITEEERKKRCEILENAKEYLPKFTKIANINLLLLIHHVITGPQQHNGECPVLTPESLQFISDRAGQIKNLTLSSFGEFENQEKLLLKLPFTNATSLVDDDGRIFQLAKDEEGLRGFFDNLSSVRELVLRKTLISNSLSVFWASLGPEADRMEKEAKMFRALEASKVRLDTLITLSKYSERLLPCKRLLGGLRRLNIGFLSYNSVERAKKNGWINDPRQNRDFFAALVNLEEFAFAVERVDETTFSNLPKRLRTLRLQFQDGDPDLGHLENSSLAVLHLVCLKKDSSARFASDFPLKELVIGAINYGLETEPVHISLELGPRLQKSLESFVILSLNQKLKPRSLPRNMVNLTSLTLPEAPEKWLFSLKASKRLEELHVAGIVSGEKLKNLLEKCPRLKRIYTYGYFGSFLLREQMAPLHERGGFVQYNGRWDARNPRLSKFHLVGSRKNLKYWNDVI